MAAGLCGSAAAAMQFQAGVVRHLVVRDSAGCVVEAQLASALEVLLGKCTGLAHVAAGSRHSERMCTKSARFSGVCTTREEFAELGRQGAVS